jgi:hypothetical protein
MKGFHKYYEEITPEIMPAHLLGCNQLRGRHAQIHNPDVTGLCGGHFRIPVCPCRGTSCRRTRGGLRLVPLVQFAQAAPDSGTLFIRQLGQFGKNFNRTHAVKLTPHLHAGKRGFEASLSTGGKSADGNLTTDETDNGLRICWSRK